MYLIYKLLRGTLAFNIFIGLVLLFVIYLIVDLLNMKLLAQVLDKFVGYGVIIVVIIFQPEVRRFLLILGNSTLKGRLKFFQRYFKNQEIVDTAGIQKAEEILRMMSILSKSKTGALIVVADDPNVESYKSSGVRIDSKINADLLRSIFHKESPLHDGAVIMSKNRILFASAVLPVSQNTALPSEIGLRHRAAVGITENTGFGSFVVSEQDGTLSYAFEGKLYRNLKKEKLLEYLKKHLSN